MKLRHNHGWHRRGFSILWDADVLEDLVTPADVVSVRQFFGMQHDWPEDLPACNGDALVVAGVEGCLGALSFADAERWIEEDLKQAVLSFQDHFEGQTGLMLWVPSGTNVITPNATGDKYMWKHGAGASAKQLEFGRLLFAGAEREIERIMNTDDKNAPADSKAWVGLYHPRIS